MSQRVKLNQAVLKATDATLTTDDWQRIMDVCDLVKMDPEDNSKIVIQCLEKRFEQKDANVILRAISLTVALAENCGSRLQQEISSKHFTNILYNLIENQQVHIILKRALAKCVEQLSESFKNDPSLKSVNDIYRKILKHHSELLDKTNKNNSVSYTFEKNQTNRVVQIESKEEDKELEEAIRLSLQEYELAKKKNESLSKNIDEDKNNAPTTNNMNNLNIQVSEQESTRKKSQLRRVKAMYDLKSTEPDELSFRKGDVIVVLEQVYRDWWRGSLHGKIGIFPINYVSPLEQSVLTENTIINNKETETKIVNAKEKIDQLHLKLQNSKGDVSILGDDSVNTLYGEVTPMRPEITKLIGKYANERDKLASLYQLLANAEATYNDIMKRTTSAYAAPTYGQPQSLYNSMTQQQQQQQQQQFINTNIPPQQYPNFPPQQAPSSYR